jgi:predicted transcriptional regulator
MASLMEMVAEIVSAHASTNQMSSDDLLTELQKVHSTLKSLESGLPVADASADAKPVLTIRQAFKKDEIVCMICGKGGFKTLTRHLNMAHELKPGQYRKQFNIPSSQSLSAKNYSESRRQAALDRGLGDNLAKARKVRAEKIAAAKAPEKSAKPVKAASQPKTVKNTQVANPAKAVKVKVSTKAAPKAKAPAKAKAVNA